jgi:peptidoglycan hydrolase-like protein with peptidoglycan-binding domain
LPSLPLRSSVVGSFAAIVAACALLAPAAGAQSTGGAVAGAVKTVKVGTKTLREGSHGRAVKALQRQLTSAGYRTKADGAYGAATTRAVRRFQKVVKLKVTGVANRATRAALSQTTSGLASGVTRTAALSDPASHNLGDRVPLNRGMIGHDVKVLQDFLARAGFKTAVDGSYGSGTVRSVKQFETDQQLTVDGAIDASDIALLRSLVSGDTSALPASTTTPAPLGPGDTATVGPDGLAIAPASAPLAVQQIIAAGNQIAKKPYVYGGGHGKWIDRGYDCSGSVSYALHAAGLLSAALPSGDFMTWGQKGPGQWVTIFAKGSHMYMNVAGLRFDTSGRAQDGSRWHTELRSSSGYTVVHPPGL